jgi:hypothetical protein
MTGAIRGLSGFIGSFIKKKSDGNIIKKDSPREFFLDADNAKTYGDIEYMRTSKSVRKTYPRGEEEVVESISALEKRDITDQLAERKKPTKTEPSTTAAKQTPITPDRKSTESGSMDMFRKMAKDINKNS